jgi:hypothetical protein
MDSAVSVFLLFFILLSARLPGSQPSTPPCQCPARRKTATNCRLSWSISLRLWATMSNFLKMKPLLFKYIYSLNCIIIYVSSESWLWQCPIRKVVIIVIHREGPISNAELLNPWDILSRWNENMGFDSNWCQPETEWTLDHNVLRGPEWALQIKFHWLRVIILHTSNLQQLEGQED